MKAMVYERYGQPEVLELREIDPPPLTDDGVLVHVRAASVNPFDWHMLTGTPYLARLQAGLRKPKSQVLGVDFAGTVEAVGKDVTAFQPGDDVYGGKGGAFGEYVCVRKSVSHKPANLSFEEAAAVPMAAITALQALRDKGRVQAGQKVLVNGASGGVGTFAVQLAKSFGAEVTGVCSTRNVETVRALGADHVIDYTTEDFTRSGGSVDVLVDIAGNHSWSEVKRVLSEDATMIVVGGRKTNRWIGPMGDAVGRRLASIPGRRTVAAPFLAQLNKEDLDVLRELLEAGKVKPVIESRYELRDVPEALRYVGAGHAKGKVVVSV
ncbi:MAG: NAD(P)-dependent alcohol dehydrogenase [Gaiellaceae bacterium]